MTGNQSRFASFIESATQVIIGFITSYAVWIFIVNPLFDLNSSPIESLGITGIFTITSLLRQYLLRRFFNAR